MTWADLKRKLSSRKLWACIAGVVLGAAAVFGLDESTISTVAGAVTALASVITYIVTEGKIDAAAVAGAAEKVEETVKLMTEEEKENE